LRQLLKQNLTLTLKQQLRFKQQLRLTLRQLLKQNLTLTLKQQLRLKQRLWLTLRQLLKQNLKLTLKQRLRLRLKPPPSHPQRQADVRVRRWQNPTPYLRHPLVLRKRHMSDQPRLKILAEPAAKALANT
jgi:hypothetical protein